VDELVHDSDDAAVGHRLPRWLDARIERGELRETNAADYGDSIDRFLSPGSATSSSPSCAAHITDAYDAKRRDRTADRR
jgi:hypothetical protein